MWENAKLILGCLGESERQSKGGIKIDVGRASMGKWRRRVEEISCMQLSCCQLWVFHCCWVFGVFLVRLCPVPGHHNVSYLLVKLSNWMFSCVSVLCVLCACVCMTCWETSGQASWWVEWVIWALECSMNERQHLEIETEGWRDLQVWGLATEETDCLDTSYWIAGASSGCWWRDPFVCVSLKYGFKAVLAGEQKCGSQLPGTGQDSGGTKGLRASCWRDYRSGTAAGGTCLHVFGWEIC